MGGNGDTVQDDPYAQGARQADHVRHGVDGADDVYGGAERGVGLAEGHLEGGQVNDAVGPALYDGAGDGLGVCDIVLDEVDAGDLVRLHEELEPVCAASQVVDGNIDVIAYQVVYDPGPQAAECAGHKEAFVSHFARSRVAVCPFVQERESFCRLQHPVSFVVSYHWRFICQF